MKVSSVVLGTQLERATGRKTASPLVRDGLELLPNLTHIVSRAQKLYFYYEVYDPAQDAVVVHRHHGAQAAQALVPEYAELFRGLSDDELVALADSFALDNCHVRTSLADQLERG